MDLPPFEIITGVQYNRAAASRYPALAKIIFQPSRFQIVRRISRVLLPVRYRDWIVESFVKVNKKSAAIPPLAPDTKEALIKYFEPYNMDLGRLLGIDLSNWNKM